jgi:hypothetical protein
MWNWIKGWGDSAALWWKLHSELPWRNWKQTKTDSLPRKSSTLAHRFALWIEGAGTCSYTSSPHDHFWQPTCTRQPIPLWKPGLKHPKLIPCKAVW